MRVGGMRVHTHEGGMVDVGETVMSKRGERGKGEWGLA